jgi:arginine decarboxylase-like protein
VRASFSGLNAGHRWNDQDSGKSRPQDWLHRPLERGDSLDLYGVNAWGNGYFGINAAGHAIVRPDWTEGREIDLHEVVTGLAARDLSTPVVVRFSDILRHRLTRLRDAFATAIAEI